MMTRDFLQVFEALHITPEEKNGIDIIAAAKRFYKNEYINPQDVLTFTRAVREDFGLKRLDSPKNPLIKKDADGNEVLYLAWIDRDIPLDPSHPLFLDPEYLVAMICPLRRKEDGTEAFVPERVIRGSEVDVMFVYAMSCCGSAVQTEWSHVLNGKALPDSSRAPKSSLIADEYKYLLKDKIHVVGEDNRQGLAILKHIALDIVAFRTNDPRLVHNCRSEANYGVGKEQRARTFEMK